MKPCLHFSMILFAYLSLVFQMSSCSFITTIPESDTSGIVDADNPNIQYIGRFNFSNPKRVLFDWAGVYICARFSGTSCSVRIHDSTDEYAVTIDDHAPRILSMDSSDVYRVASGLTDSVPHTIILQKRTEPLVGRGAFMGFILDRGARLLAPEKRPGRRIEYIGNSITSGFGVMGDSSNCNFTPQTEDAAMSFAAIASRALGADYHMISYSGRGVVRNYGDKNKISVDPMPALYDRTCNFDSTVKWDFTKWIPQSVVINLGTNDFSTEPHPDRDVFEAAYDRLINRVRALYPGVTMFCVTGPMIMEPCTDYVSEVVRKQQQSEGRDKDVFLIDIPHSIMDPGDWGCAMHPNIFGAEKMANIIVPLIRLRMNW
ncbi:MAG TPA: SGNH/GDSL hydrolase family protein [Candidatus Kryptonia bacterium]